MTRDRDEKLYEQVYGTVAHTVSSYARVEDVATIVARWVVALVAEREQAARAKALEDAAKAVCEKCDDETPLRSDGSPWFKPAHYYGGLWTECAADDIRLLAAPPQPERTP